MLSIISKLILLLIPIVFTSRYIVSLWKKKKRLAAAELAALLLVLAAAGGYQILS